VNVPGAEVSSGSEPVAAPASPAPASLAVQVAAAGSPASTGAGQVSEAAGAVASTRTVADAAREALPARSRTDPLAVCAPVEESVRAAGTDAGSTPEPALPSTSGGSPAPANVSTTESRCQPACSGARSGVIAGRAGSVRSTTTVAIPSAQAPRALPSEARTR
jgi:hypothetical protein